MGFTQAESDMWLLKRRKSYDYMDVYVDDLWKFPNLSLIN